MLERSKQSFSDVVVCVNKAGEQEARLVFTLQRNSLWIAGTL
jgi:hypothetical protein